MSNFKDDFVRPMSPFFRIYKEFCVVISHLGNISPFN